MSEVEQDSWGMPSFHTTVVRRHLPAASLTPYPPWYQRWTLSPSRPPPALPACLLSAPGSPTSVCLLSICTALRWPSPRDLTRLNCLIFKQQKLLCMCVCPCLIKQNTVSWTRGSGTTFTPVTFDLGCLVSSPTIPNKLTTRWYNWVVRRKTWRALRESLKPDPSDLYVPLTDGWGGWKDGSRKCLEQCLGCSKSYYTWP